MKTMRIGITIGLTSTNESLWINGIKQNALALAKLLSASPAQHTVTLLNTTTVPVTSALPWDITAPVTQAFELQWALANLDVLILLGGQLAAEPSAALGAAGVKLVGYKCGSEAVVSTEAVVHGTVLAGAPYYNPHLNALWLVPQVAELNAHYYRVLHRCDVAHTVPFVWDPAPLEAACIGLPHAGLYAPKANAYIDDVGGARGARLTVLEPNRDLLKTFLTPLLIAECLYRTMPEAINVVRLMNLHHRRDHAELKGVLDATDLHRDSRVTVEGRFETPWVLAHHTDAVVSHQWGNPLNYAYLEACWLGYPLVHNAELCRDLGFYYAGHDVAAGAAMLGQAISLLGASAQAEQEAISYRNYQRASIARFLPNSGQLQAQYDNLLSQL